MTSVSSLSGSDGDREVRGVVENRLLCDTWCFFVFVNQHFLDFDDYAVKALVLISLNIYMMVMDE